MTNYDSDVGRMLLSSDIPQEDNIHRIQAKLQNVTIGEFAKFVDFVNNEFGKIYTQLEGLSAECVEFEEKILANQLLTASNHNKLIDALRVHHIAIAQSSNRETNATYLWHLKDAALNEEDFTCFGINESDPVEVAF